MFFWESECRIGYMCRALRSCRKNVEKRGMIRGGIKRHLDRLNQLSGILDDANRRRRGHLDMKKKGRAKT